MLMQGYLKIPLPAPIVPRRGAACVLLPDFRILVAGNPDFLIHSLYIWRCAKHYRLKPLIEGGSHFSTGDPLIETEMLDLRR